LQEPLIDPVAIAAGGLYGAGRGVFARAFAREATEAAIQAGSNALIKTGIEISEHAALRMSQKGITKEMVETAITKGIKYFDPKNGTFNYILKNGFASGKDLLVATNTVTGYVTTVIRGNFSNMIANRLILVTH
jgi:hypothetical protein